MKRILVLIIFFTITFNLSAQINSSSVEGVNCYNDTGFISLAVNINSLFIQWEYRNPAGMWEDIATFPFIYTNSLGDTLWTTQCYKYKATVWFDNGAGWINEIDSFSIPCPVTIGQGQESILCYGDSSGTLKRPVSGGAPFDPDNSIVLNDTLNGDEYYIYTWYYSNDSLGTNPILFSDTTWTLDSLYSGWYKTIVRDNIGCIDSLDYTPFCINFPALIRIDTQIVDHNKCIGDTTASVFLTIQGGIKHNINNKYFYYLTLNNDTIAFSDSTGSTVNFTSLSISNNMQAYFLDSIKFNNLASGSYIFSVVDSNACVMHYTIEILDPDAYIVYSSTTYPLICASDTGVFLIDSITGGNPNIDFYFLGLGNDTINVPSGTYDIFVKDLQFGCIDTLSATFLPQYEIKVESSIEHILCFGGSSGTIVLDSIYGGNAPYTIEWGGINPQVLSAGIYTAFIVDSLGCTLMQDFTVEQSDQFSANAIFYLPSCNGLSDGSIKINLTGGVGPLSYYWLNGTGTADSLYALTAGIYYLVVSDSFFCSDTISLILNEPAQLDFSFTNYINPLLCNGEITTIDIAIFGGTGPFSVIWNDGNTAIQRLLIAGTYYCQVSDFNGCITSNNQIIISEPDSFSIQDVVYSNATCDLGGDAIVNTIGGTSPIQYIWSTGATSQSIDSLWEANYWVIATDSCGNSDTAYFNLIPSDFITVLYYDSVTHIGGVEVIGAGGPFSYEWIDMGGNIISIDSVTSFCEGTYFLTTTDNTSSCSVVDTLIATYDLPNGIMDISTTTVFPDDSLWGAPPYTYLWDNGEVLAHANICPGSRWVEVTDNIGCVIREDFNIDPLLITFDPAGTIIECSLENLEVELEAIVSGGTEPYTYQWSGGSTNNPLNISLSPGNHSVTVMDNNACNEDTIFMIATMSAQCVPNVFSPNGDDINDVWKLENTFLYDDSEVKVYGRYGKLLFKSIGYTSPWDGKNNKGNDVPDGAYFYSIEIGHDYDPIRGSVTILR